MEDIAVAEEEHGQPAFEPSEGRLLEVVGMENVLVKTLAVQDEDADVKEFAVDGCIGRCVGWFEAENKCIMETFDGLLAGVPVKKVQEYYPPPPEQGGFDVAWPAGIGASEMFGEIVCQELAFKGFCLIQTCMSEKERSEALKLAQSDCHFYRMKQEIDGAYMGHDNFTKLADLGLHGEDTEIADVLDACDRQLSTLALLLSPLAPTNLGFSCHGRLNGLVRMSIDKSEEDDLQLESIMDEEDPAEWSANVQSWVRFQQRRKLCVMYLVANDGGDLWLYPKEGFGPQSVHIPLSQNKILIFRHDLMDYSYQALGVSLALQTWVLSDPPRYQEIKEMQVNLGTSGMNGEVVVNPGPEVPEGPQASVMSLTCRLPGEAWHPAQYWQMYCSGTDAISQWPQSRWATDPYYQEGCDSNLTGKAYTCHGGFISQEMIAQFDNRFFGIADKEAKSMLPGQRVSLEVGYQCLVAAGFSAHSLAGRRLGLWFGDVGPDWHSFQTEWGRFNADADPTLMSTSMNNSVTAGRIAHLFDLRGPVSSYDTACSASLVAMNAAHLLMFDSEAPKKDNSEALVCGVNTLLGPGSFIGNCMATMLSHQGRSFTFNRSADGYQRGEGCGSIFVKLFMGNKTEEEERVCALVGTATNQDGRSASLTAPNGPAQQAVITKSMRFAAIDPNTVSIAECHGTGTALGDPIEVGALMAVMHQREFPLLKTSAKSNIAHLEAGAGIAGLTKCIMMINMATAPPNCHLNVLNPHLTTEAYPVHFDSEDVDTGFSSLYCGVSSFGFGGTNSRADVFGYASRGHKAVIRYQLPTQNIPRVMPIGQNVYICGSWTAFSKYEAMQMQETCYIYSCAVALGATKRETFYLSCSEDAYEAIHPLVPNAPAEAQVVGPDWDVNVKGSGHGKSLYHCWLIDGESEEAPVGTVYDISFRWEACRKTVSWQRQRQTSELEVLGRSYEHRFYLTGSFRNWEGLLQMERLREEEKGEGECYEARFKIGCRMQEEFHIIRDGDPRQTFHPSCRRCSRTGVPVLGPDDQGKGLNWLVPGRQHQEVRVRLRLLDGQPTVTLFPGSQGAKEWLGWQQWARQNMCVLYLSGSINDSKLMHLTPDVTTEGVYTCRIALDEDGLASFHIVVDEELVMYPDDTMALQGPRAEASRVWVIKGLPNAWYEIKLDLTAKDRTRMLTWSASVLAALS